MTINDISNGISIKLNQSFGDGYKISDENIEQGLDEPCFFILSLSPSQTQMLGNRYHKNNPCVVHYFPSTVDKNKEMHGMADQLFDVLEYITLINGDVLNGTEMHYEIVDGVLEFFVNYNAFVIKVTEAVDSMETATIDSGLKG